MDTMKVACSITLDDRERSALEQKARGRRTPARLVTRAKIVLLAAQGWLNKDIALEVGVGRDTVGRWRTRFVEGRLAGIEKDAPRGGRKPTKRNRVARRIIETTTSKKPEDATHWSTRTLGEYLGVSRSMVQRVWKANGLKPYRVKTFKLSNDKCFVEKMTDVIGLYLNPPEHALVLCADEKTSIQALDRTQPGLPIKKGRCGTMTHDYKRNGTTTLFAALELAEGRLFGTCMKQHRHQEWLKFLRLIDRETSSDVDLHLIVDNYATHKHPNVKKWLEKHPRFHIHFTPTSSSWLNLVERWFGLITDQRIRRGVFKSEQDLIDAIMSYIENHNANPRTFIWTAKVEDILEKIRRARSILDKMETA
jgi:transposase